MYSFFPYYFAKILAEAPGIIILPIILTPIVYFGIGFSLTVLQYFKFMLSLSLEF